MATTDTLHPGYLDATSTANNVYTYKIQAVNPVGMSPGAVEVSSVSPPPPEGPQVTITPSSVTMVARGSQQFVLSSGASSTWVVLEGIWGGNIDAAGLYTDPNRSATFHVLGAVGVAAIATVVVS